VDHRLGLGELALRLCLETPDALIEPIDPSL
jgi:hypothetical protein